MTLKRRTLWMTAAATAALGIAFPSAAQADEADRRQALFG